MYLLFVKHTLIGLLKVIGVLLETNGLNSLNKKSFQTNFDRLCVFNRIEDSHINPLTLSKIFSYSISMH